MPRNKSIKFIHTILTIIFVLCILFSVGNYVILKHLTNAKNLSWDISSAVRPGDKVNATIRHRYCSAIQSVEQIRVCYPRELVRQMDELECATIETWDDVQRCLTGRFTPFSGGGDSSPSEAPFQIHVVGERNSGTKFVMEELQRCFPRSDFSYRAHRDFVRSKHFFQTPLSNANFERSIVVSIFRDPIEWTASMLEKPYHSPSHIGGFDHITGDVIPLHWQEFVTKTWVTKRSEFDLKIIRSGRIAETFKGDICIQRFSLYDVVPCRYENNSTSRSLYIPENKLRGYWPIYELRRDKTGRPFNDILELRREKIVNHLLEIPLLFRLAGFAAVRYEDLLVFGTRALLEKVAMIMGMNNLPSNCIPSLPQQERIGRRSIPDDFRNYVKTHVDVKTERLLGYIS